MTAGRFAPFDGIRAIAVLLVLAMHINDKRTTGGWIGVELFFVLSGYLITSLLLTEHQRTGQIDLRAFYLRRMLRLAPALVVMLIVVTAIAMAIGAPLSAAQVIATFTYTMDAFPSLRDGLFVTHTWSLAVEEQFYLIWPALLILGVRRAWALPRAVVMAAIALAAVGGLLTWLAGWKAAYGTPFPHLPVMLAGVLLAFAAHRRAGWLRFLRSRAVPVICAVVLAAVVALVSTTATWLGCGGIVILALPCAALVGHLVVQPDGPAAAILRLRPMVWLGQRSYGFYLWHLPALGVFVQLGLLGALPTTPIGVAAA